MRSWIVKGKPADNDLSAMLVPGRQGTWHTRKPPKDFAPGDRLVFWEASPTLKVVGLGVLGSFEEQNDGETHFGVHYRTRYYDDLPGIAELRAAAVMSNAAFLKSGPSGVLFELSDDQARFIYAKCTEREPELRGTWPEWEAADATSDGGVNRRSLSAARSVVESLLPREVERDAFLLSFADTILEANRIAPSNWGATLFTNGVRVNVGWVNVLWAFERMGLLVDLAEFKKVARASDSEHDAVTGAPYASAPNSVPVDVGWQRLDEDYARLRPAHFAALREAARLRGYKWKDAHSPGLVAYVSEVTGGALPNPDYAPVGAADDTANDATTVDGATEAEELVGLEGGARLRVVWHRRRERRLRDAKLAEAIRLHGRLVCEVPGCGFDFAHIYGALGDGYAQVHHVLPLGARAPDSDGPTLLADLAVVCANCHAMIHVGGQCRPLESIRVASRS